MRPTEQCNVCQVLTGIKQINMLKTRIYAIINSPLHLSLHVVKQLLWKMFTNTLNMNSNLPLIGEKMKIFKMKTETLFVRVQSLNHSIPLRVLAPTIVRSLSAMVYPWSRLMALCRDTMRYNHPVLFLFF